ncbi:hypothetical protein GCM10022207_84040 [Streptomyces lannensis]|uniref:Uncharacterized protein n=1 Tax=Streptomyces lannensis TaxID=766498 RepID=A0ABP7LHT3_9ACTN
MGDRGNGDDGYGGNGEDEGEATRSIGHTFDFHVHAHPALHGTETSQWRAMARWVANLRNAP